MPLRLGDIAPNFRAETTKGEIDFYEWVGKQWVILFSHPIDFTPVCTTELGRAAALHKEFTNRGTKLIALSLDSLVDHKEWIPDIEETQKVKVDFPIIADEDRHIAELYDMIHPNTMENYTVRTVFIIDPRKRVRLTITYPPATGRNFQEILRALDSLQLTNYNRMVATPVDWKAGEDVVIHPGLSIEEANKQFPKGITEINSYIRYTPQPDKNDE
ncbi:MAG: peroxiredoxin [Chitinophagales bacterium]|nr:peroxiredoxin [Chitinophagales bacterium]